MHAFLLLFAQLAPLIAERKVSHSFFVLIMWVVMAAIKPTTLEKIMEGLRS